MTAKRRSRRKLVFQGIAGVLGLGLVFLAVWAYPTMRDLKKIGFFDSLGQRKYNGDTVADLKALRIALMSYEDSEGEFPKSNHWMEAIQQHLRTDDMSGKEAAKKFVDPVYAGQTGKFGFALNDAVAGKYKGDIKDPKTPLVFESEDPARDSHGDPEKLAPKPPRVGGDLAIAVDGTILQLSK
jgi:hypothetical protein